MSKASHKPSRQSIFMLLMALSIMSVIVSNIITNKQTNFFGFAITCGTFLIPVSYIVNDIMVEVFGFKRARTVVLLSFLCNLLAVVFFTLTIIAPQYPTFTEQSSFEAVLGSTPRILIASFSAFLVGSLLNAKVMDILHVRHGEHKLALRCILSTVIGETCDMVIFGFIAFLGTLPIEVILQIIIIDSLLKILVEVVFYPIVTCHLIKYVKKAE